MSATGTFGILRRMIVIFDELQLTWALGGSVASSLVGEPRTTIDVDVAVRVDESAGEALLARVSPDFYVPLDAAREAIRTRASFNVLDVDSSMKMDIFVVGDGLLDRLQIDRRVRVDLPEVPEGIWVTSTPDQVLRKLDWFRQGGGVSDRQWRDVVGILRVHIDTLDLDRLRSDADELGLSVDLREALAQARS